MKLNTLNKMGNYDNIVPHLFTPLVNHLTNWIRSANWNLEITYQEATSSHYSLQEHNRKQQQLEIKWPSPSSSYFSWPTKVSRVTNDAYRMLLFTWPKKDGLSLVKRVSMTKISYQVWLVLCTGSEPLWFLLGIGMSDWHGISRFLRFGGVFLTSLHITW